MIRITKKRISFLIGALVALTLLFASCDSNTGPEDGKSSYVLREARFEHLGGDSVGVAVYRFDDTTAPVFTTSHSFLREDALHFSLEPDVSKHFYLDLRVYSGGKWVYWVRRQYQGSTEKDSVVYEVPSAVVLVGTLEADDMVLFLGERKTPQVTIAPSNASNRDYRFTTSDTTVTLDGKSLIGRSSGPATIRILSEDGNAESEFKVQVRDSLREDSVALPETLVVKLGDTLYISSDFKAHPESPLRVYPEGVSTFGFNVVVQDDAVAVVGKMGSITYRVIAVGEGETRLSVAPKVSPVVETILRVLPGRYGFEKHVRPILELNCYKCHGEGKPYVNLSDSAKLAAFRDSIPLRIESTDPLRQMPPPVDTNRRLTDLEKEILTSWLDSLGPRGQLSYEEHIRPIQQTYCLKCHHAGGLYADLSDSAKLAEARTTVKLRLTTSDPTLRMPPPVDTNAAPTEAERERLFEWFRQLDFEENQNPSDSDTTVTSRPEPDSLRVDLGSYVLGDTVTPVITWYPAGTSSELDIQSSDPSVAQILGERIWMKAEGEVELAFIPVGEAKKKSLQIRLESAVVRVQGVNAEDVAGTDGLALTPAIEVFPADAENRSYSLVSDNPDTVQVSGSGLYCNRVGKAKITVTTLDGGHQTSFQAVCTTLSVTLTDATAPNLGLLVGDTSQVEFEYVPSDAGDTGYTLTSSDNTVAKTLENPPRVLALSAGKAEITAAFTNFNRTFVVSVSTKPVPLDSFTVAPITLEVGDSAKPSLTFHPADATEKNLSMEALDPQVLVRSGHIHGVSVGTGRVRFTPTGEAGTRTLSVTVKPQTHVVTGVSADDVVLKLGQTGMPAITWIPANATNKGYSLQALSAGVVEVAGGSLKAVGLGNTSVRLTTNDGGHTALFIARVDPILVTSLSTSNATFYMDQNYTPSVTVSPTNATNKGWYLVSGNTSIVTTPTSTRLFGKSYGTTTVSLRSSDGKATSSFTATVKVPWSKVSSIVSGKCNSCHASLSTNSWTSTSLAASPTAYTRVSNNTMPPGGLPAGEKALLLRWLLEN